MSIVIVSNIYQISNLKDLYKSFVRNCIDYGTTIIYLLIPENEQTFFEQSICEFNGVTIKLCTIEKTIQLNVDIQTQLNTIHSLVSDEVFQKICVMLNIANDFALLLNIKTLFIRKFKMIDYINQFKETYFYCQKHTSCPNNSDNIFDIGNNSTYDEIQFPIIKKTIVIDMIRDLHNMYEKYEGSKFKWIFERLYYMYCHKKMIMYPRINWFDIWQIAKDNLTNNQLKDWCKVDETEEMIPKISKLLYTFGYNFISPAFIIHNITQINAVILENCFSHNLSYLVANRQIVMCSIPNDRAELCRLIDLDMFNKSIIVCISGLIRDNVPINLPYDFIFPMNIDSFFYVSGNKENLYYELNKLYHPKKLLIDNNTIGFDESIIKFPYFYGKLEYKINTYLMLKKRKCINNMLHDSYDIIVSIRPDLLSLDGKHLCDILTEVLLKYDDNTIYIPKVYNSVGISDQMAIGSEKVMKCYFNLFEKFDYFCRNIIYNPELMIYEYVKMNNLKIKTFNWNYKIRHHNDDVPWWKWEFDVSDSTVEEYFELKSRSTVTLYNKFYFNGNKKYIIKHIITGLHIFIDNCNILLNPNNCSLFFITPAPSGIVTRMNIKWDTALPNMNNDKISGWNIFTSPHDDIVYGKGNNGIWAQFYIISEKDYYYIATYHSHTLSNRKGTFGRYLGISDGRLVSNMEKCDDAKWFIRQI